MSEILTKDDFVPSNGKAEKEEDLGLEAAIENIQSSLNDIQRISEAFRTERTLAGMAFYFGTFYLDLKHQLENVLEYLNDRSTK